MRTSIFTLAAVSAGALMLSACGSESADSDGDGEISADEAKEAMADVEMTPGEYEMTVSFSEIDAPGLPEAAKGAMMEQIGKGTTVKTCITEEQAKDPGASMFGQPEGSGCTMDKLERSGNEMSVDMTCEAQGMKIVSVMDGTFEADGYAMDIDQKMTGSPAGDMSMKGRIESKRIGDCAA
ncbi:MAG: DUF3617 domain-containing protein [Pseudomonadota bacterium]